MAKRLNRSELTKKETGPPPLRAPSKHPNPVSRSEFQFDTKEKVVLLVSTAPAIWGLRTEDLVIALPMLALTWAGWSYVCWVHRGKWYWRFGVFATISLLLCYLSMRSVDSHLVPVTFKEPPEVSTYEKLRVRFALTRFNAYLSDVGFDTSKGIPPIGFIDRHEFTLNGAGMDRSFFPFVITLPHESATDGIMIDNAYMLTVISPMVFSGPFGGVDSTLHEAGFETACTDYFIASYIGYIAADRTKSPWLMSLWEMRGNPQFGKAKTDRILFYALQQLQDDNTIALERHDQGATGSESFDLTVYEAIEMGVRRTSNNVSGDMDIINEIFKRQRLEFK